MGNCLTALRTSKPVHIPDIPSPADTEAANATPILATSRTLPVSAPSVEPIVALNTAAPTTPSTPTVLTTLVSTPPVTLPSNTPSIQPRDLTNTRLTTTAQALPTKLPPNEPQYAVFISHAGEDKATIAIPLREKLGGRGITAFVDEADILPGADSKKAMIDPMETANVAVIILSPEFVAREWPMREVMCFLRRREECAAQGQTAPIIIPCFYRLRIDELYGEPRLDRKDEDGNLLYHKSRFEERQKSGELGASVANIKAALGTLHGLMGVRNDWEASNESSFLMARRREMLLQELSDSVGQALLGRATKNQSPAQSVNDGPSSAPADRFRKYFPPLSSVVQAVLDFGKDEEGYPMTPEGWVKHLLLEQRSGSANVVAIHGLGGVGKSTILRALSVDCEIKQRFADGVHLITLGMDASRSTLFRQICQVLKDSGAEKTSQFVSVQTDINQALHCFENWFNGRRCAFLIDDVWVHRVGFDLVSRLMKIGSEESGSCVLLTTREHEIATLAPRPKAIRVEAREKRGQVARQILFFHAELNDTDHSATAVGDSINDILDICDGLPVSLAAAGKNIKMLSMDMANEEGVWERYRSEVKTYREGLLLENVKGYGNLFTTFATSISILDQQPRQKVLGFSSALSFAKMHRRLCVLRKQAEVPSGMLKRVWEVESEERANKIVRKFVEAGLASRKLARTGGVYVLYLSLHDSLHDFSTAEATRHDDIKEAHDCLLKGYSSSDPDICCEVRGTLRWWSPRLEADGYIHGNVCRHLVGAGRDGELVALLLSPLWTKRQLELSDPLVLEEDFGLGIRALQEGMREASVAERCDSERALRLISEALSLSSGYLLRNPAELWFQLSGRLVRFAEGCSALRDYICRIERDGERPMLLCNNSCLTEPGEGNTKILSVGVEVNCIVVLNDAEDVACGVHDGWILVVSVKRGVLKKKWSAHEGSVLAIAAARDGALLVSGSWDGTAKVWDVESCRCVALFGGHTDAVRCITVMKDERRVISGSYDGTARVWDLETGRAVSTPFTGHDGPVEFVVQLADEAGVVTGGSHDRLRLWNVTTGELIDDTFDNRSRYTSCIAVTSDGRRIVIESREKTYSVLRAWDVEGHELIESSFRGPTEWVRCVALNGDGRRAVCGSVDFTIRVSDMVTGTEICDPLTGHTRSVTGVSFLAGNDRIVSSSWDETVRIWDIRRRTMGRVTNRPPTVVRPISFSPDGEFVLSLDTRGFRIWNTTSGREVESPLPVRPTGLRHVTLTFNRRILASVYDNMLHVWNLNSAKLEHVLTGHTDVIMCVASIPQRNSVVTGSLDKTVRVWSLAAMHDRHIVLEGHNAGIEKVFVTDDGLWIVSVDREDLILVWNLETKTPVGWESSLACGRVLSRREVLNLVGCRTTADDDVELSTCGREIVYDNVQNGTVLATMESDITRLALSPDKKTICVGLQCGQLGLMKLER